MPATLALFQLRGRPALIARIPELRILLNLANTFTFSGYLYFPLGEALLANVFIVKELLEKKNFHRI